MEIRKVYPVDDVDVFWVDYPEYTNRERIILEKVFDLFVNSAPTEILLVWKIGMPIPQDDDVESWDWVPGDWGYVANNNPQTVPLEEKANNPGLYYRPGYEGENVIYVGKELWWGHISSDVTYKSMGEWRRMMQNPEWAGVGQDTTKVPLVQGELMTYRWYPQLGLSVV